ncbi:Adenylate cyclase 1 [compost metagenome]
MKFMGDGFLAIFPLSEDDAGLRLIGAVKEAEAEISRINTENKERGVDILSYGIGIHLGDVMYGNIGSRRRLDFTVIGRAVNVAARLEALTKQLGRQVLVSSDFVAAVPSISFDGLGAYELKRLETPVDVYTPRTG